MERLPCLSIYAFNFNFYELGSILCWFCCISHFMFAFFFFFFAMTFFPLLYIYLRLSEVGITFGCLVFTIERHLEAYEFLPRRLFAYFDKILPYINYIIFTKNKSSQCAKISFSESFFSHDLIHSGPSFEKINS